jgi:hypothetical protein
MAPKAEEGSMVSCCSESRQEPVLNKSVLYTSRVVFFINKILYSFKSNLQGTFFFLNRKAGHVIHHSPCQHREHGSSQAFTTTNSFTGGQKQPRKPSSSRQQKAVSSY